MPHSRDRSKHRRYAHTHIQYTHQNEGKALEGFSYCFHNQVLDLSCKCRLGDEYFVADRYCYGLLVHNAACTHNAQRTTHTRTHTRTRRHIHISIRIIMDNEKAGIQHLLREAEQLATPRRRIARR